ncbi:hypothetical protein V7S43_011964 [Phytophthora oleae]|uniref:EamA domain-containing protein n=1 Tax=Phytophthora oleae TaxID=2107226 RepID=A0ABD3FAN0_9STRA
MSVLSLRKSLYVAPQKRTMLALRCLAGFFSIAFAFYAISQMVLADASCITFSCPIFTFFSGACLLHERIDPVSLLSVVFAFSGLVFVVRPGFIFGYDHPSDGASWDAIGAAFLGALGQVFVFITVRKLQGVHALVIVHYFMLSSAIAALGWVFIVQKTFFIPSAFEEWQRSSGAGCSLSWAKCSSPKVSSSKKPASPPSCATLTLCSFSSGTLLFSRSVSTDGASSAQ